MDQLRAERIARNEASVRETNETLGRELSGVSRDPGELAAFVCECGDGGCRQFVKTDLSTYARVRGDSRRFLVVPGHEIAGTEDVIELGESYAVVEKHDDVRGIVEATDPRDPR